jgi:hypothetical protein
MSNAKQANRKGQNIMDKNDWCILRMTPSRTLAVLQSIEKSGVKAWTPKFTKRQRVGRARELISRELPLVPGIVFADFGALDRLISMSRSPGMLYRVWDADARRIVERRHPPFSVFRYLQDYPRIADSALDPLRRAERSAPPPRDKVAIFDQGAKVRTQAAGFDGLIGVVDRQGCNWVTVTFAGFEIPVKVAAHLLQEAA